MKVGSRRHANTHLPWGSDPIPSIPAVAESQPFASVVPGDSKDVVTGVHTFVGFESATLYTNRPDIFTLDLKSTGPGTPYHGLGIHAPGFYKADWTLSAYDKFGARVAAPQVEEVFAQEGSTLEVLSGMQLGSIHNFGYFVGGNPIAGAEWDVAWSNTFAVVADTSGIPIVCQCDQNTGETLEAYAFVYIVQCDPTNLGLG